MVLICGIIPLGVDIKLKDEYPLVRSSCDLNIVDVYQIAHLQQEYESSAPIDRNVEYTFPLPSDAAVCSFKAIINDTKVIKGIVKEKGEAKRLYQDAVAKGKTAGLLEKEHVDSLSNIL